jgi:hypothetical protein
VTAPPSTTASFDAIDDDAIAPLPPSDPTIEIAAVEMSPHDLAAFEEEEEKDKAPSSSRRPISLEEKMAEEDDAVPLHVAPPKSGPLPAASPAIELGGFDADPSTGVRRYDELLEKPARAASEAPAAAHAEPPSDARVATFIGHAPKELAALSFGELLDASLALLRDPTD